MEFTGERFVLGQTDIELEIEHLNRYQFALQFAKGKRVLDAACGTGYGSAILAQKADSVIGIDISEEAVQYAIDKYGSNKISFKTASIENLPFEDNTFDVVVSYETLEHVSEKIQYLFLKEIKRVLTEDGILVISTPNHDVYKNRGENHFHIKELNLSEFKVILENKFINVNLLCQQFEICNAIVGQQISSAENINGLQLEKAEYLIAVCSNEKLPKIQTRLYIRPDNKLNQLMDWAIHTHLLNEEKNTLLAEQNKKIHDFETTNNELNNRLFSSIERIDQLSASEQNLQNVEKTLNKIIQQVNVELKQKDNELQQLNKEIQQRDFELEQLSNKVPKKDNEIIDLRQTIVNKEGHISLLLQSDRELERIKSSRLWRIMVFFRHILDVILPQDSKRRLFAKLIKKFIKHPISFIKKINPDLFKKFFDILKREGASGVSYRVDNALGGTDISAIPLRIEAVEKITENKEITDYRQLIFKKEANPKVSIIIPVYNQFEYTYNCLKSLLLNSGDVSYEIIVANDCSTDLTTKIEQVVSNIQMITNKQNLCFLKNCNNAAKYAKSKYILFLNNDTQVQENWLEPLVELIEHDKTIGLVGSKLIYADGKLQEAGGIVWNDASAWNYGNRSDPNEPEYNYVKEVDYISGASIMISKELWNKIGGFDERFAPAYYEDSDLAFEVRKLGYKVVYQPKSVVVHYEGISNGIDANAGQKLYQIANQKKFYEKWKEILIKEHFSNGENVFLARDRSTNKRTILFIDHYIPTYDKDAGSRTIYQYLKLVVEMGYNIKFIGDNFYKSEPYATELEQMGIEILYGPYYFNHWKEWIRDNGSYLDVVFMNRPHISIKYIDWIHNNTDAKIVYNVCDLHFLREKRQYEITNDISLLESAKKWEKIEYNIMEKADVVFTLSTYERDIINSHFNENKSIICPVFIYDTFDETLLESSKKKDLIFVGGFIHVPNVDGVIWFTKEIFPMIQLKIPQIKFHIVGSNVPEEIKKITNEGIIIHGYVSDITLEELYKGCRVCVIPLRFGAGVKGKTIEAMYNKMAIVSTSIGLEGLDGIENCITAKNSEKEFAQEVIDLYEDDKKINLQAKNNLNFVRKNFSKVSAKELFNTIFKKKEGVL